MPGDGQHKPPFASALRDSSAAFHLVRLHGTTATHDSNLDACDAIRPNLHQPRLQRRLPGFWPHRALRFVWQTVLVKELCAARRGQSDRDFLIGNNWCRVLPITELTPDAFAHALSEIEPLQENPLDALAAKLKQRLPQLF